MQQSTIHIDVQLDDNNVPQQISWVAPGTTADKGQKAKAMMLAFWDGTDKTALRLDLWTKDMMVDEMADFFYQSMMTMAETYQRATKHTDLVSDIKNFAKDFYRKFREQQTKENQA